MDSAGMAHILSLRPNCAREDGHGGVDHGCVCEQAERPFAFSLSRTALRSWCRFENAIAANTARDKTIAHLSFSGGAQKLCVHVGT